MFWGASDFAGKGVARATIGVAWMVAATVTIAQAQAQQQQQQQQQQFQAEGQLQPLPRSQTQPPQQAGEPGVLESIGRWLDRQGETISSSFKDAGKGVENFGHEAGVAAKSTVEGAKDAAGAVVRIPVARVVTGHEVCKIAPNGAPDCAAAAVTMCKARGFAEGKSADMTTAEVCPARVYMAGRNTGPECRSETFVSRALCQ